MNFGFNLLGKFEVPSKLIINTFENGKTWLGKMVTVLRRKVILEGGLNIGLLPLAERSPFCRALVLCEGVWSPGLSYEWAV